MMGVCFGLSLIWLIDYKNLSMEEGSLTKKQVLIEWFKYDRGRFIRFIIVSFLLILSIVAVVLELII